MKKLLGVTIITAVASIALYETLKHYGKIDQIKGKYLQEYGKTTGDLSTRTKGIYHSAKGEVKETLAHTKDAIQDRIKEFEDWSNLKETDYGLFFLRTIL